MNTVARKVVIMARDFAIAEQLWTGATDNGFVPQMAMTIDEAQSAIETNSVPDVLLLCTTCAHRGHYNYIKTLKATARTRNLAIIVLSRNYSEEDCCRCLAVGADDYVGIPFSVPELYARTNSILKAISERPPLMLVEHPYLNLGWLSINSAVRKVVITTPQGDHVQVQLKNPELEILALLALNVDKVLDRSTILKMIWGPRPRFPERAIDVQIYRIRAVLRYYGYGHMLQTVRGEGYCLQSVSDVVRTTILAPIDGPVLH